MSPAQAAAKRIIVVDDEVKFCSLVSGFLQARGYDVATVSNGAEALAQIEHFHPDVVLLDILMPGLSGLELLRLLRDRAFPPRVIMVTANDQEDVAQQAMQQGAEAYMCKPVDFGELERVISRIWPPRRSSL